MEATPEGTERAPRAGLLTAQQQESLLTYARLGSIAAAGRAMNISPQTVKNHLSESYSRLGVRSGPQAIYVLMGGDDVAKTVPEASRRNPGPSVTETRALRRRVSVLERQLDECEGALTFAQAEGQARRMQLPDRAYLPLLTDGEITVEQLDEWSARFDVDAGSTSAMRISAREWVELLRYYVKRPGSPMVSGA